MHHVTSCQHVEGSLRPVSSFAGTLLPAPRFSKHLHGTASLFPDAVEGLPYWFVDNHDGTFSPASWEEMAATEELDQYEKVLTSLNSPDLYGACLKPHHHPCSSVHVPAFLPLCLKDSHFLHSGNVRQKTRLEAPAAPKVLGTM